MTLRDLAKSLLLRRAAGATLRELDALSVTSFAEPVVKALAQTVSICRSPRLLDAAAAGRVGEIEAIRRRYGGSSEEIQIIDYGAGPPDAVRTEEEMRAGTPAAITLAQACRASKPFFWSLFLFHLVRELKPRSVVELGTCLGLSAAYQGAALKMNGGESRMVTLEGAPELAARSRLHFEELRLPVEVIEGSFQTTFEPVLQDCAPIDLLFVDGHHDEGATLRYFREARPFLSEGGWIVFDDIDWSDGMRRAWAALQEEDGVASIGLGDLGVLFLRGGPSVRTSAAAGAPDPRTDSQSDPQTQRQKISFQVPKHLVRYARPN